MVSFSIAALFAFAACTTVYALDNGSSSTTLTTSTITKSAASTGTTAPLIDYGNGTVHSPNDADGLYIHLVDSNGQPQKIYLGNVNKNSTILASNKSQNTNAIRSYYQGEVVCENQYTLNYQYQIDAEQGMENAFGSSLSFTKNPWTYTVGTVVAYACNYGDGQTAAGPWIAAQFQSITTDCGASSPGWVTYPNWKAEYGVDSTSKLKQLC